MDKETISLTKNDAGQILEGVEVLIEQWEATAVFLETGLVDDSVCIRESHNPKEALRIAATYREIHGKIEAQLELTTDSYRGNQ